uniref:Uncharacterized protein n=1 Tax=Anguilla anguilla TaxID=7936 RepID=A0A0E9X1N7_ANGAN
MLVSFKPQLQSHNLKKALCIMSEIYIHACHGEHGTFILHGMHSYF